MAPTVPVPGTARRVLVTGAAGFVGRELCARLAAAGLEVTGLVRTPAASLPPGVRVAEARDLSDEPALRRALEGKDAVVHLAARVHALRDTAADPLAEYRRVNVEGTRLVAELAADAGARTLVLASTVKVMGESNQAPWTEAMTPAPVDPYAVSKLEAEELVRELATRRGLHAPIFRLPLVYGPGVKANMLRLFQQVARGTLLPLGGVANRRSLLYLGNLCAAVMTVLEPRAATDRVFFLRDGRDLSTPELIRLIGAALGRPARLIRVPPAAFRTAGYAGDLVDRFRPFPLTSAAVQRLLGSLAVDASAFTRATGFSPPYAVEEGLRATAEWFRTAGASAA